MLLTMIFLRTINPGLEEAGRLVSGWRGVVQGISIPLILPGILLSGMLVFLLSFGEFSVPGFLRYAVFPVESFTQFPTFYNFKVATAAVAPMAAVMLMLLLAEARFLRERTYRLCPYPGLERLTLIALGRHRNSLFALVAVIGSAIVIVPIIVLALQSAGIDAYAEALNRSGDSLLGSILYAVTGATLLTFVGFFTGYLIQTKALGCWRTVDSITIFLFALPGTVIGIGLISLWNTPWSNFIYAIPLIILLGYVARYTALTSRITVTQLAQIPPSMEEAAQVAGAGWFRRMALIVMPLSRRGLLAAWMVGYIFSLRDTGSISIAGERVSDTGCILKPPELRNLGMVFQDLALWPHLSVKGNLEFGLKAKGIEKHAREERIRTILNLTGMDGYAQRKPAELSGGQQQRVALARALVLEPGLLLMDEPLSGLDLELNVRLRQEILQLQDKLGFTLLYVTHDRGEAFDLAMQVIIMSKGRVDWQGTVKGAGKYFAGKLPE